MECIEGVLLLGLGSYTFAQPDRALTGFIVMYGIVAVTMGIADICSTSVWSASQASARSFP